MVFQSKLQIDSKEVRVMFWCSFIVTALLVAGIILVLNIDKKCLNSFWEATRDTVRSNVNKRKNREKHISLKKKTELLIKGKKQNFVVRTFRETEEILAETHRRHRIKGIYILSGICAALGLVISLASENIFIAFPLTFGAALVPTWIVKLSSSRAKKQMNTDLEVALSGITTSYLRSDDIISAVEENLVYLNGLLKQTFSKFVNENKLINSNITLGIQKIRASIDNDIFQEWCDALYQCQSDRTLKVTLFPIVNKFSETKAIQAELDTLMMAPFKDTISVVIMVVLSIPLMALINGEWFNILVETIPGQIIMAATFCVIVYAIDKSVRLTAPIKRSDGK